jgi:hypothetical protein
MNVISPPEKIGHKDPLSLGMLPEVLQQILILQFNDIEIDYSKNCSFIWRWRYSCDCGCGALW